MKIVKKEYTKMVREQRRKTGKNILFGIVVVGAVYLTAMGVMNMQRRSK